MTALHLDVETYSECDLKACGLYKYAEHESTELLVVCYAFGQDEVQTWIPGERPLPNDLVRHITSGGEVRAHNAQFERCVLNGVAGQKVGFPKLSINQMVCTAAKMANHGLPRALGDAAKALGTYLKDDSGRINMLALSKPRSGRERRWTPENAPERFKHLYSYCADDVRAERGIDDVVPDISAAETWVYRLDQKINDRGIAVDLSGVSDVQSLIEQYKDEIRTQFIELTGLEPTQRAKIADWIREHGYPQLLDMQAETVKTIVASKDCPEIVKLVLKMYSTYGMKAVTKYGTLQDMVCSDGKLHGMFLYYGAGTGRWSSTGVQLQNLFRPVIDDADTAIEAFKERDLLWVKELYPKTDPMKVFASCIRGMLIASPGCDLMFPDFAGIESRVNAWLWEEEWKLQAFRDFDAGVGPDTYKLAYARAFHILVELVTKQQRQIGKVMELALGYEGGVGAFITMLATYGVDLDELGAAVYPMLPDEVVMQAKWMIEKFGDQGLSFETFVACDGLKQLWRASHPNIAEGWKLLKNAAGLAIEHPGKVYRAGKILFSVKDRWLYMKLPSGRRLAYFSPSVDEDGTIRYWGVDTKTRRYMKTSTYGGKLDENAVQAISRDLLVNALQLLEENKYSVIGSVHDEALLEVLENYGSLKEAGKIMCTLPAWAAGLPVAVEGHRAKRYRK